jgi:hypothetical protein
MKKTEYLEIYFHIYDKFIFNKNAKEFSEERMVFSMMVLEKLDVHVHKKTSTHISNNIKMNSKWIRSPNVKSKLQKPLEYIRKNLHLGTGKQDMKNTNNGKNYISHFIKIISFYFSNKYQ